MQYAQVGELLSKGLSLVGGVPLDGPRVGPRGPWCDQEPDGYRSV